MDCVDCKFQDLCVDEFPCSQCVYNPVFSVMYKPKDKDKDDK